MKQILIEDYNYPLADERIAKYPLDERDSSKLLIYRDGGITEDHFRSIGNYLPHDALLIYNNTRVIQVPHYPSWRGSITLKHPHIFW